MALLGCVDDRSRNDSGIDDILPKVLISPNALQLSMKIVVGLPSPRRRRATRGEQAATTAFTDEAAPEAAVRSRHRHRRSRIHCSSLGLLSSALLASGIRTAPGRDGRAAESNR